MRSIIPSEKGAYPELVEGRTASQQSHRPQGMNMRNAAIPMMIVVTQPRTMIGRLAV